MIRIAPVLMLCAAPALADPPEVVGAAYSGGSLSVTLTHPDTGWDHYADAWEVLDAGGESLGVRDLTHPHVEEQPFTRSLRVTRPGDAPWTVRIRARDNLGAWSEPLEFTLD
ncbi:hypothetical protein HKCCE3408_00610 [Rhodobacterales bacterium HKCCE3408]|nr:hypothetical protein [Rhodobacterales bacterium HKCCE3408]